MDKETIKKAKQGDADKIGQIILENMQTLYRVAFGILKNDDEIYDAISSTTVKVFENIHTLKKEEYVKTWITRILINECYKICNKNKKIIYLENVQQKNLVHNDTHEELEFKNLIRNLNDELKEIVILYYFEDFSIKEISKIIKIPEGTVKTRLSRARKKLEDTILNENKKKGDEKANG